MPSQIAGKINVGLRDESGSAFFPRHRSGLTAFHTRLRSDWSLARNDSRPQLSVSAVANTKWTHGRAAPRPKVLDRPAHLDTHRDEAQAVVAFASTARLCGCARERHTAVHERLNQSHCRSVLGPPKGGHYESTNHAHRAARCADRVHDSPRCVHEDRRAAGTAAAHAGRRRQRHRARRHRVG